MRALETALRDVKRHRDALRGSAGPILSELRLEKPSWVANDDPFLLLAPGKLRSFAEWASTAKDVWAQVDRLSPQSRRALEEAVNSHFDGLAGTAPPAEQNLSSTPLLRQAIEVIQSQPEELSANIFGLSFYDLEDLKAWFEHLIVFSTSYVVRVAEVEEEQRRDEIRSTTRAILGKEALP
jgi:hypothetical protein